MKKFIFFMLVSILSEFLWAADWKAMKSTEYKDKDTGFFMDMSSIHKQQNYTYVNIKIVIPKSIFPSDEDGFQYDNVYTVVGMKLDCDKKLSAVTDLTLYSISGDLLEKSGMPEEKLEPIDDKRKDIPYLAYELVCKNQSI